jgi:subfamily B ATP-binding cassette protein MsbA
MGAAMNGRAIFIRLLRECRHYPGRLVLIVLGLAGLGGGQLCLTWFAKLWADGPLRTGDYHTMARLSWEVSALTIVMMAGLFISRYELNSVNQRMVMRLRNQAQHHLLGLEVGAIRRYQSGDLMSRMLNDAGTLSTFVREILRRLIGETFIIGGAIAMIFYLNWRLALITGLMVPVVAIMMAQLGGVIRKRGAAAQKEVGNLSGALSEQLAGVTTIKGFRTEEAEERRFGRLNAGYLHQTLRGEFWSAMLTTAVWLVTAFGVLAVVWYGTTQVGRGQATPGGLLVFCLYAIQTVEPLRRLSEVQSLLQRAIAAAERVFEIIDLPAAEHDGDKSLPANVRGEIVLEHVSFAYRADKPVLADFDLRIGTRETLAVVATSGGGKSTLAAMLVRFRDPDRGCIRLDGIDIRELRLADLRRAICVAEQEPFLFSGPLIDNIRYGSWDARPATIEAAVALAGIEPLVRSLPGGLQTPLIEGGRDLSGGQRQRIALARVIVRNPSVVVLDEATSALDSDTESQIFAQLRDWLSQRTVLVMAHRLATISRFPRIVVLENGRVIGDGSVSELLANCPSFSQLFGEQLAPLERRERRSVAG